VERPSWIATAAAWLGGAALCLAASGPLGIRIGALTPMRGFNAYLLACALGLVALAVGAVGLWFTRPKSGRPGRSRAVFGAGAGLVLLALVAQAVGPARGLPPVNDITTNPDDPPLFDAAARLRPNRGRDMGYAGGELARVTREAYPDLAPIRLERPPEKAFGAARRVALRLRWRIVSRNRAEGILEAMATSRVFRFVDDVVVRIRPSDGGSVVDVRSKSRDGRGDLGANAARIRAFRAALLADARG
jgi:uncharacterized protein (DUF1499 family)